MTEPRRVDGGKGEAKQDGQEPRSTRTGAREPEYGRQSDGGGATRITVDLPGDQHGFLKTFVARSGSDGMSVVHTLLVETADDPKLQARVRERLSRTQSFPGGGEGAWFVFDEVGEAASARGRKGGRKPVMDRKKIALASKLTRTGTCRYPERARRLGY